MDNQPIQDTICLLAGSSVPRAARPGEQFEPPKLPRRRARWQPILILLQMARLWLGMR